MPHVEDFCQAARRPLFDGTKPRQFLGLRKEAVGVVERDRSADTIALENSCEVIAVLDRRDDRQASPKIVDRLRRNAEACHSGDGRDHAHITGAEELEIFGARDGRTIDHIRVAHGPLADGWRETPVANEQERQIGARPQCRVCCSDHLLESAAFDQLPAEHCDWRVGRKRIAPADGGSIDSRSRRSVAPDRGDQHFLSRPHAKPLAQIIRITGERADDRGETAEQPLLPGSREPDRQAARNAADLVMVVGKEVPDEQQAVPDSGPRNFPDERCNRNGRHPRDCGVEGSEIERSARDTRRSPAAKDELACTVD